MENKGFQPDVRSQNPHAVGQPYPPQTNGQPYPPQTNGQPYPPQTNGQPYPPQTNGQPYPPQSYGQPQPGIAYTISPPYDPSAQPYASQPQHQQPQVVGFWPQPLAAPFFVVGETPLAASLFRAIVLSCVSFWFCGMLFGGIAFILAIMGQSSAAAGDTRRAIQMRNVSYGLSIAGIVSGIIIIAVAAGMSRWYYFH